MRLLKKGMVCAMSLLLSGILTVSGAAASFDFSSIFGNDPIRSFFTILNLLTTKNDAPTYTETPLEPIQYTEEELARKQKIVDLVNKDLNLIKTAKPAFRVTAQRGLPGNNKNAAQSYFERGSEIADSIFRLLFGENKNPVDTTKVLESIGISSFFSDTGTFEHVRGTSCETAISVAGKPYVSALRAEDVYSENPVTKSRYNDSYEFKIYLQDAINPGPDSAQARVFDLFSDVKLYQTIQGFIPQVDQDILRIRYVDCYIQGSVDRTGHINEYRTHYKCVLQINTEQLDYDITQYLDAINNTEIYESETLYTNFDWTERPFGDVNNDGKVNSADARYLLRVASHLDEAADGALEFGDVNFDGKLNSADARILLRVAGYLQDIPERPSAETPQE